LTATSSRRTRPAGRKIFLPHGDAFFGAFYVIESFSPCHVYLTRVPFVKLRATTAPTLRPIPSLRSPSRGPVVLIPHSAIRDGPVFRIQPTGWTASGDSHRNGRCLSSQLSKRRYNSTGIALTDLDAADNANVCQRLSKVVPFEVFLLIVRGFRGCIACLSDLRSSTVV
jgi:hypothetical protein